MPDLILTIIIFFIIIFIASCLIIPITLFIFYLKDRKIKANVPELIKKEVSLNKLNKEIEIQKHKNNYSEKSSNGEFEEKNSNWHEGEIARYAKRRNIAETYNNEETRRKEHFNAGRKQFIEGRDNFNEIKREIEQPNRVQLPASSNTGINKKRIKLHKPSDI